ncbi:PilX N-terminal domain-containing pilus assembly protein [Acidovorax sp. sic0104]|uniref:pilus assembly PilX family protein n=1 Tax=Acidovorax sp. sic0104 TaxID=2854784 RepID=UPI001C44A347|nr:PilX N-terminal domain-containing pilus assembly protein [Acidovorax sp. sic0104]MBV7539557.1 pilus assembly protein PilX [Acidovorax sp. sic0104]
MHRLPSPLSRRQRYPTQRGVALFVVIVFVMLSMLLALWASRTSLFNEMVVGNDADYQRAFEAAQTMLQDAEQDIRLSNESPESSALCTAGGDVCRSTTIDQFPLAGEGDTVVNKLLDALSAVPAGCRSALCIKREGSLDFWNNTDVAKGPSLAQMLNVGARYGQYTGAKAGDKTNPANPILADRSANKGAWYWIEVLPYDKSAETSSLIVGGATNLLPLKINPYVVYRITALAYGRKSGTMVTMQQTYAPVPQPD